MDPFLEAHWGDVHTSLTTYARDQLQPLLPTDLRARVEEYVHLESEETDDEPRFSPDVRIVERPVVSSKVRPITTTDGPTAAQPYVVPFDVEWTERWVQIFDGKGNRVVTTIEFLSPGNKTTGPQREQFQNKQRQFLEAGVSLVEIDLIRAGGWAMSAPQHIVPKRYSYPYRIIVIRADRPTKAECYSTALRDPLPAVSVPLRPHEPDVLLDLQRLVTQAWESGGYEDLDYLQSPCPPFRKSDEAWIQERIAAWTAEQSAT
jgi:hypothetical protein